LTVKDVHHRILSAIRRTAIQSPKRPTGKNPKRATTNTRTSTGGVASLDELVLLLNPDITKGSEAFATERSRISHHLKNILKPWNPSQKQNRENVAIQVNRAGRLFV